MSGFPRRNGRRPTTDPDVTLECEQAIDGAVRELVDHAMVAGWPPEAAFEAIKRAADRLLAGALLMVAEVDRGRPDRYEHR
jgi:hypothetical protein